MGYTTDFIGHVDIYPPLNAAEQHYLTAFGVSRRFARAGGPYEVPPNPAAEEVRPVTDLDAYNREGSGQPSLWCGWRPCWDGCCLAHDGVEKFYGATQWMAYLIDHFLAPNAAAEGSGLDCFAEFTFDHVLDGIVAGCRRDTRELYLIRVDRNVVSEQALSGRGAILPRELLPYEQAIDDARGRRSRRPRTARAGGGKEARG